MFKELNIFFESEKIEFSENIYAKKFSYIKTGGLVKYLIKPDNEEKYVKTIIFLKKKNIEFFILGKTTNTLFDDNKTYECIVQTSLLNTISINESIVEAQCGLSMPKFAHMMLSRNITGFELLEGIPGSIGGGIFMNASTFNNGISDNLISVKYLNNNGKIVCLDKKDLNFSFRKSIFHDEIGYIISAKFSCIKGERDEIFNKMKKFKRIRLEILEYRKPNLGSNFCTYDIYNEIAKNNILYKIFYKIFRFLRLYRLFSNKFLNNFTKIYFSWKKNFPYSDKTLNSFKKEPHTSSDDLIEYLNEIKKITKNKLRQEIRII